MSNYLYNGMELPDINTVWDKEKYPYAIICRSTTTSYFLQVGSEPFYHISDETWGYTGTFPEFDNYWFDSSFMTGWLHYGGGSTASVKPDWSSYDLYTTDGTLYLAASDPIPVGSAPDIDPRAFMEGLRMGQIVRGMRMKRVPIAYSYNGVVLPDIYNVYTPELQKTHPFAVIRELSALTYLYASFTPITYHDTDINKTGCHIPAGSLSWLSISKGAWRSISGTSVDDAFVYPVVWAKHDVLREDGTLFFAASDPIPVYE